MSESANGGEVQFVRLWLPGTVSWIVVAEESGQHFHASLTQTKDRAGVFVSPSDALLKKISDRLGAVELQEATYAEWVESGGSERAALGT